MTRHLLYFSFPAAYSLLPHTMDSTSADAFMLAIALQESRCKARRQVGGGPARGYWQFERGGGVVGVMTHPATKTIAAKVLDRLNYPNDPMEVWIALEHNDVLASVFARLLLWTLPQKLPEREADGNAWNQYLAAWRPGKPHRETWSPLWAQAWDIATGTME